MKTATRFERHLSWEDHKFKREMIAPGVERFGHCWGVSFFGKQDAMIKEGIAEPEWFSDGKTKNSRGYVKRQKKLIINGRNIETTAPAKGSCTLCISYTPEEQEIAQKLYDEIEEQERSANSERSLSEGFISDVEREGSAQKAALQHLRAAYFDIAIAFNTVPAACIPWTSSPEVIERANELFVELRALLTENPVKPSKMLKARNDKEFQRFMSQLKLS